jgi:glycosyltransferase involved in cell wall biosynthesis
MSDTSASDNTASDHAGDRTHAAVSSGAAGVTGPVIAVVIPCYRETAHILDVVAAIGNEVSRIFVVDDACPEHTGEFVRRNCGDSRVEVIVHSQNQGVGGATLTGYGRALAADAEIIVKLDGDGQMDPALIADLVAPIVEGRADYAKGNRFHDPDGIIRMPTVRIFGNLVLSFAANLSSGSWNIFDPTNGFTAIQARVAERLPFEKISKGFFFESDMLFRLGLMRAKATDVPMRASYGDEKSSLKIRSVVLEFTAKHWLNAVKRIVYTYFLRDFNVASIHLALGKVLFLFGLIFGAVQWRSSVVTGIPATAGTVVLAALPIILGSQMLVAFIDYDTRNTPRQPLHPRLRKRSHTRPA